MSLRHFHHRYDGVEEYGSLVADDVAAQNYPTFSSTIGSRGMTASKAFVLGQLLSEVWIHQTIDIQIYRMTLSPGLYPELSHEVRETKISGASYCHDA